MTINAGGAATFQGTDYQARVAAWLCARALAGSEATPLWNWDSESRIQNVWMETLDDVDDIRVDNANSAFAFIQAKHRVSASRSTTSPFGKAIRQFVSQFPTTRSVDRLVLALSS